MIAAAIIFGLILALLAAEIILRLLEFGWDWGAEPQAPDCFGEWLSGAPHAERDCGTCYFRDACQARTRFTQQQRARDAERTTPSDPFIPVSLRRPD